MAQKPLKNYYHIHIYNEKEDVTIDFDTLTKEQQGKISQALNEQAARNIVIRLEDVTA